jgi:hypothetical protein
MTNAFTKLALSIAARKAGKILGMAGIGAGLFGGSSHLVDVARMGLPDAITLGKSYYSPILKAVGAENIANANDELTYNLFKAKNKALEKVDPSKAFFSADTPEGIINRHRSKVLRGAVFGGIRGLRTPVAQSTAKTTRRNTPMYLYV